MTPPTSPGVDPPDSGADGFYHPASEEELIALVVMAAREVRQCRVRGSAHSVSHAIYTDPLEKIPNRVNQQSPPPGDGVDIMLDCYQQLTVIDSKEKLVQAQAGIHLGPDPRLGGPTDAVRIASEQSSLLGQLWAKGWTLDNLGGITRQTVSGFTATGSSGGSVRHSINENIWGFTVIDAQGTVHEVKRDDADPKLFYAQSPHVGLLGVVSTVTLKCVDAYNIAGQESVTTEAECAIDLFGNGADGRPTLEQFLREAEYARLVWWPQRGAQRVQVWQAQRIALQPGFKRRRYEEFTAHPETAEVLISLIYTVLGNLGDLSNARQQLGRTYERIGELIDADSLLRSLGPVGQLLARFLTVCTVVGIDAGIQMLQPFAPYIERELPAIFPRLLGVFVQLDSEREGIEKGEPQSFHDTAWQGLPMDSEVDDTLLPTGFTEIWLPLPRTQQAMQLLRTFFTEPASAQESYARTGLYGWELYAAQPTDFWMSASHTNGEDEWKDGVFRIDPYWFGANPGDPTRSFYPPLWELLRDNGVPFRLHWGKYQPPYVRGDLRWVDFLRSHYPRWDDFLELRRQRDPDGIFLTSYWRERFGLPAPPAPPPAEP